MALFKNGGFVTDSWRTLAEGEGLSAAGHVILPLDWYLAERDAFAGSHAPLGVLIEPGTDWDAIVPDLPRLAVIALLFPKFGDGRAFSTAALLRTRHGYTGEIRAVGDVLFDQLQPMARCGFDAFEISDAATFKALQAGKGSHLSRFYQPARRAVAGAADMEVPVGTRPWLRRAAS